MRRCSCPGGRGGRRRGRAPCGPRPGPRPRPPGTRCPPRRGRRPPAAGARPGRGARTAARSGWTGWTCCGRWCRRCRSPPGPPPGSWGGEGPQVHFTLCYIITLTLIIILIITYIYIAPLKGTQGRFTRLGMGEGVRGVSFTLNYLVIYTLYYIIY